MILRAEPRTIMRFVEDNYEVLTRLYRIQLKENLVNRDTFEQVTQHKGELVTRRLFDYRIVKELGDDYRLTEAVGEYLGFLMQEFKPLLPEQLYRYHTSIRDMFDLMHQRKDQTDGTRALRLEHLYTEVLSFLDNVTNNTYALLKQSQRLKSNRRMLSYKERVLEARRLIEQYIDPLTNIVNLNDANSLASLLQEIGLTVNLERMAAHSPVVQDRYEQLDQLLRQVNRRLQQEGDVIRRELLPLIERVKRESEVLGGWLLFLERPLLLMVPDIGKRHIPLVFGDQTGADLRMYVEQFARANKQRSIRLPAEAAQLPRLFIDRRLYRKRLQEVLPLADFFGWCQSQLEQVPVENREHLLIELTSLLFSDDRYYLAFDYPVTPIRIGSVTYRLPRVYVRKKNDA
jgi:hypothetical protein